MTTHEYPPALFDRAIACLRAELAALKAAGESAETNDAITRLCDARAAALEALRGLFAAKVAIERRTR